MKWSDDPYSPENVARHMEALFGVPYPPMPARIVYMKRQEGYPPFYPHTPPPQIEVCPTSQLPPSSSLEPAERGRETPAPSREGVEVSYEYRPAHPGAQPGGWYDDDDPPRRDRWETAANILAMLAILGLGTVIVWLFFNPIYWR